MPSSLYLEQPHCRISKTSRWVEFKCYKDLHNLLESVNKKLSENIKKSWRESTMIRPEFLTQWIGVVSLSQWISSKNVPRGQKYNARLWRKVSLITGELV